MLSHVGESFQIITKHTLTYLGDLQSHKIDIDGEKFSYLEGGQGPVLLFLHGLGGSKTVWRTMMQQLSANYRVLAIDLPGFCMQQLGHPKYRTIRDMVGWLHRFVERLQLERFHLMAACSGAVIACTYALQQPSRVQTLTAIGFPDLQNRRRLLDIMQELNISTPEQVDPAMQRFFYRAPAIPGVVKRYYVAQVRSIQSDFNARIDELLNALPQLMPRMRALTFPILLVSGEQDIISTPASLEQNRNNFGVSAQVVLIPCCGHFPFLEKPDQTVKHFYDFQMSL